MRGNPERLNCSGFKFLSDQAFLVGGGGGGSRRGNGTSPLTFRIGGGGGGGFWSDITYLLVVSCCIGWNKSDN